SFLSILICSRCPSLSFLPLSFFFFNAPATSEIYTLSLHDALPISLADRNSAPRGVQLRPARMRAAREAILVAAGCLAATRMASRSEEHTSELQSRFDLVCRLLLEKKKKKTTYNKIDKKTITKN